ncbi:MAG: class I SAM-dependent DNA methyltransferase [Rhodobacter sp.]|nr:class I SAM-dependent DNA methyltransferase [Rhodobacter sp.]MCA3458593.1 class I SAM-dependent DNA methyltransferase [Rhodobacter sp.]MCA3461837.1 class I SAM-dependent DNA methyltransferase [Rhodobacter sp.]MCA3465123.1 class I SAM-dependent DNA methyltransferase [Rhodobacter sp.]MCA3468606.1 class I SAM-dependent DNA methyltransferase [Rhodobacter sp.]
MTPHDFITKWSRSPRNEHQDAQAHFIDLCHLLGVEDPAKADPAHDWFTFEKGASKTSGGRGWADVWRRGCFGWEYKSLGGDLKRAYTQLLNYSGALESPPLLIVSDMDVIEIHTNWTNTVQKVHTLRLPDLADAANRDLLRHCFLDPDRLKPAKTRQMLTEDAAQKFVAIAQRLRDRGHDPQQVAHFVNRLVFCMFAEDVQLLPKKMFERMIAASRPKPETFATHARTLFAAMRDKGGAVGFEAVEWFNGGLFDSDDALPLDWRDIDDLIRTSQLDWSDIDPSILGTLFERGLDPDKRSQLGAHYTDRDKIMMIVNPVIVDPLKAEWAAVRAQIETLLAQAETKGRMGTSDAATRKATALKDAFKERLRNFRILDPACGSGNFLYLALAELKSLELAVNVEAEALGIGLASEVPLTGPENLLGIELNPYAAELARVSVWIGDIQWSRRNGFEPARNPILRTLNTIECRDAVLAPDGGRADWPKADVVVGNPPFLGGKKVLGELGKDYTAALRKAYSGTLPDFSDLVCYWFVNAWSQMQGGKLSRAGLVSTNSIRGGSNRAALSPIVKGGQIFDAWSDEAWTVDGAAVRVSLICFVAKKDGTARLNGFPATTIFTDLTATKVDLTTASVLEDNRSAAFIGVQKTGPFDIPGETARTWLKAPLNPNGRNNSEVLKHYVNGAEVVRRPQDTWIIDFGPEATEAESANFEAPFQYALQTILPIRRENSEEVARRLWWRYWRARPEFYSASKSCSRVIITPRVSKHRVFVWRHHRILPDSAVVAIARDDDTTFGILHSRFHELWSLRMGTFLGVGNDPRYTPSTTFETFPFPQGLTPNIPAADYADDPRAQAIAAAAARLNAQREAWLNPPDLVRRVPEVVPGYPDRLLPVDEAAAKILKTRTLTNLYNSRPAWLDNAHKALDQAVADAYGWGDDWARGMGEDDILARLFRLNQDRAATPG